MNKRKWLVGLALSCLLTTLLVMSAWASHVTYVIQRGDTLFRIAVRFNTTVAELSRVNNIVNPNYIYVGQRLIIPHVDEPQQPTAVPANPTAAPANPTAVPANPTAVPQQPQPNNCSYVVQRGDTLASIARRFGTSISDLANLNSIWNINYIYVGQTLKIPCSAPQPATPAPVWPTNTPAVQQPQPTPYPTGPWVTNTPNAQPWPTNTPAPAIPTNTPVPQATSTPVPQPTNTPAPVTSTGFGLGGQTHTFANPDLMRSAGMNWVKFQHKWSNGQSADVVRDRINNAQNAGFKVLLSIPGADHTNIDFGAYVDFLGGVAALGPDAIEVWNEQNIDREWPTGSINATSYVNDMLKPAYQRIKATNSSVMVISGAPAPTGYFGGGCTANGCDDKPYIEEMARAGAVNYMDCMGVHYNEGILPPTASSGDPRGNPNHYTRYYPTMVNTYKAAINYARPLCFTELGYLSGDDYGGVPGGFSWARDTSIAEHAEWLGEATRLARVDPGVQMLIIFNIDFTLYERDGDPQAGFGMLRKDGSCPACSTVRAASGR